MDDFAVLYSKLKPSIVAIVSKVWDNPYFPPIIGTGFIVREDGVILTNNHVIRVVNKLPRLKSWSPREWPIEAVYFHEVPGKGMMLIHLEVDGVGTLKRDEPLNGYNYGPDIPDLGTINVNVRGLPSVQVAQKFDLLEGEKVLVAGFPMGTNTLRAPGWVHQLSPTLQSGVVSAILPFPCENPHAVLLDIMTQGGSSGSPVFNPKNGEVIGIVYGGLVETKVAKGTDLQVLFQENTSLTLAIPAKVISEILEKVEKRDTSTFDTIETLIAKRYSGRVKEPKSPHPDIEKINPQDLL